MKNQRIRLRTFLITLLMCICTAFFSCIGFISRKNACALTDIPKYINNRADLFENNSFDKNAVKELIQTVFNGQGVSAYIKENAEEKFGSKVVSADTVNKTADIGDSGIVLKLNGYEWMITSITVAENENKDVVLTLYMPDIDYTAQFDPSFKSPITSQAPSNMYSSSNLRINMLNYYNEFISGEFAQKFLVKPKFIQYQHIQDFKGSVYINIDGEESVYYNSCSNDALDNVGTHLANHNYYGKTGNSSTSGYSAWGEDYVWLPSLNEVGRSHTEGDGIWGITKNQRAFTGSTKCWMRTACDQNQCGIYCIDNEGYDAYADSIDTLGVRIAVHFNLTAAANSVGVCLDVDDHEFSDWIEEKKSTCIFTGIKAHKSCLKCGENFDINGTEIKELTIPVDKNNHSNLKHTTEKVASCIALGNPEYWHCTGCNNYYSDGQATKYIGTVAPVIPLNPSAHNLGLTQTQIEATCTSHGTMAYKVCSLCQKNFDPDTGNVISDLTIPALGHSQGTYHDRVEAGCTVDGNVEYWECANGCGKTINQTNQVITDTVIKQTGHDYQAVDGGTPPTCTTAGSGKIECTRCGDEKAGDLIPALGHKEVTDLAIAPTCLTAGKTEGKHCSVCSEILVVQTEIATLGHDWATEWSKDGTNHWRVCSRCSEKGEEAAHSYEWVITKQPTVEATGLKENVCTVCGDKDGEEEIAKLVVDEGGNGNVSDLPPDNAYALEIAVKESDSVYNIQGISRGYKVELYVVDGDNRTPYDDTKTVTLMLVIPDGMDEFTLYKMSGDRLMEVTADEYKTDGKTVTIRTTLPTEFVFNSVNEEKTGGIPWWVWLLVCLGGATLLTVVIIAVVIAKKKSGGNDGGTPVVVQGDNGEIIEQLAEQGKKIDELLNRDDGGFNTPVELDENGNVIWN